MNRWTMPSVLIAFCTFIMFGGQTANAEEPTSKEIQDALSFEIPNEWRVEDFTVEVSQNVGSAVEPLIKSRFRADVRLVDNTYIPVANVQGIAILSPQLKKDEVKTVYGISTASLNQGSWKISFELQGQPFANAGKPRGAYPGRTLIGGSDEHRTFVEELEAARAKEAERLKSERLAAEAEKRSKEQAYQEKSEAHFASAENIITSGVALDGLWSEPGNSRRKITPFRISFITFNSETGEFKGQMTWKSGAVLNIEGVISDSSIRYSETAWVNNPKGEGNNFIGGEGKILGTRIEGIMCANADLKANCRQGNANWVLTLPRD